MPVEPCLSRVEKNTVFATTPAEFNLTDPRPVRPFHSETRNSEDRQNLTELIRLRSSAFWELRRSIAENGEGFVRRMRDYEGSRSRQTIHLKVREAEKRGRKRVSSKKRAAIHNSDDDDDDEEEIQICSGNPSSNIQIFSFCGGRGVLHAMDDDNRQLDSPSTWHMRSCPSCKSQRSSNLFTPTQATDPRFPSSIIPSSPSSTGSLSTPSLSHATDDMPSATSCHRVVAALNLALANGAGSIEDYSSLQEYQSRFQTEYYDHGDLWH